MNVADTGDNAASCICPNCPTYNECMTGGGSVLFCARGKSDCDVERQGCICGECPVQSQYRNSGMYYCVLASTE